MEDEQAKESLLESPCYLRSRLQIHKYTRNRCPKKLDYFLPLKLGMRCQDRKEQKCDLCKTTLTWVKSKAKANCWETFEKQKTNIRPDRLDKTGRDTSANSQKFRGSSDWQSSIHVSATANCFLAELGWVYLFEPVSIIIGGTRYWNQLIVPSFLVNKSTAPIPIFGGMDLPKYKTWICIKLKSLR